MDFSIEKRLFDLFPSLQIGVLICDTDNTRYGEDRLETILEATRGSFSYEKPQDHPHIKVWRDAFKTLGISAAKYFSSIEALLRRALKGGPFPRINPVVDLYNAVSLKHLVPVGGHDIAPLEGNISLSFAAGTEPFVPMDAGELEVVDAGEVVYRDEKEVLTRRWVWRQSNKDKVVAGTKHVFIPVDVMEGLRPGLCSDVLAEIEAGLALNGIGRVLHRNILTKQHPATTFRV